MAKKLHGGTNAYNHRYVCRDCERIYGAWRRSDRKKPSPFRGRFKVSVRSKKVECPVCKSTNIRSIEKERQNELAKQERCYCSYIPFPHKKGSIVGCEYHEAGHEREWDELDQVMYEEMLNTPRLNDA